MVRLGAEQFNESTLDWPIQPIRLKYIFGRATMEGQPPLSTQQVRAGRNPDGSIRLPSRRPPDTRPGMIPLSGNDNRDPYQYIGHIRALPRIMPGPSYTVPPNWPARAIDNEVGRSAYPGSPEPIRIDSGYRKPRVTGGDLTVGADFTRNVTVFSSHYGEGQQVRVPAWRYGV